MKHGEKKKEKKKIKAARETIKVDEIWKRKNKEDAEKQTRQMEYEKEKSRQIKRNEQGIDEI